MTCTHGKNLYHLFVLQKCCVKEMNKSFNTFDTRLIIEQPKHAGYLKRNVSGTLEIVTQRLIYLTRFAAKVVLPDDFLGVLPEDAVLGCATRMYVQVPLE